MQHVLWNKHTRNFELWTVNKNHASYGLKYKNTHLEFCASYTDAEREHLIRGMRAIQNFGEQHSGFHSTLMNAYRKHIAA